MTRTACLATERSRCGWDETGWGKAACDARRRGARQEVDVRASLPQELEELGVTPARPATVLPQTVLWAALLLLCSTERNGRHTRNGITQKGSWEWSGQDLSIH